MTPYEPPRVTFIGSDPKIPALNKAITRVAYVAPAGSFVAFPLNHHVRRFVGLWQARNRRTRVLMERVKRARENA